MTRTYEDHSVPTPLMGSVPQTGTATPGASSAAASHAIPLRRAFLAGGAALAMAAGSASAGGASPDSPDGGLIALCARLNRLQRQVDDLFPADWAGMTDAGLEAADAAARLIEAEQHPILDQLCAMMPVTVAGFAALARSTALLHPELGRAGSHDGPEMRLLAVLVRGLVVRT